MTSAQIGLIEFVKGSRRSTRREAGHFAKNNERTPVGKLLKGSPG